MTFAEFYDFLFDNAFFRMPFIEAMVVIFIAMSIGAALVGVWNKVAGKGTAIPVEQTRKAA
ncbi:MAG TPA: hypothetical protein VHF07_04590 [Nitrospiraceae bacterium]|nr:hypothetical protein [Nitrospiraceae bacterium]